MAKYELGKFVEDGQNTELDGSVALNDRETESRAVHQSIFSVHIVTMISAVVAVEID